MEQNTWNRLDMNQIPRRHNSQAKKLNYDKLIFQQIENKWLCSEINLVVISAARLN